MSNDPGNLRHRIAFVSSSVSTPDGIGGGTRVPVTVATVWGRIEPTSARESNSNRGIRDQRWWRVTIRYPDFFTVTADMRVLWNNRTFYVKGIMQPEAITHMLVIDCLEGE